MDLDSGIVFHDNFQDVAYARWKILESVGWDDGATIKSGGKPQVEGIVGDAGQQNEPTTNQSKITMWSAQVAAYPFVFPPHLFNDRRCETVRPKE